MIYYYYSQEFNATTQPALNVALNGFYDSCKLKAGGSGLLANLFTPSTQIYKFKHFKQGNQYHGMISFTF